jgi:carboxynorspermidine decarboxylase
MSDHEIFNHLGKITNPAFVADEKRLLANLAVLADIKQRTGAKIIYAMKACPLWPLFGMMAKVLDGSTASGLYEARLGKEKFGKEVHVYNPAYTAQEVSDLLALNVGLHVYFNTIEQLKEFGPMVRANSKDNKIGLRLNPGPELAIAKYEKYNPCRRGSHLGVPLAQFDQMPWNMVDTLHVHALSENMAEESALLIDHIAKHFGKYLAHVKEVNFGGGHFITNADYKVDVLVEALNSFRAQYPHVTPMLEPGAAVVHDAGYLVSTVLGFAEADGVRTAMLDVSANCHVPDVHKAGITLEVLGAETVAADATAPAGKHTYALAARTCMARDIWGTYAFDQPLKKGDRIIFRDGLQYSLGEANHFNGHPLPDFAILRADGRYEVLKRHGYEDFCRMYGPG